MNKYKLSKNIVIIVFSNPTVFMATSEVFGKHLCFRNCEIERTKGEKELRSFQEETKPQWV